MTGRAQESTPPDDGLGRSDRPEQTSGFVIDQWGITASLKPVPHEPSTGATWRSAWERTREDLFQILITPVGVLAATSRLVLNVLHGAANEHERVKEPTELREQASTAREYAATVERRRQRDFGSGTAPNDREIEERKQYLARVVAELRKHDIHVTIDWVETGRGRELGIALVPGPKAGARRAGATKGTARSSPATSGNMTEADECDHV